MLERKYRIIFQCDDITFESSDYLYSKFPPQELKDELLSILSNDIMPMRFASMFIMLYDCDGKYFVHVKHVAKNPKLIQESVIETFKIMSQVYVAEIQPTSTHSSDVKLKLKNEHSNSFNKFIIISIILIMLLGLLNLLIRYI